MSKIMLKKLLSSMSLLLILVQVTMSTNAFGKNESEFPWYFDRSINGIEIWKNKDQIDCRIVISTIDQKLDKNLSFYQSEDFLKDLQLKKKATLTYLGIENWTSHVLGISETKQYIVVDFAGDYKDNDKNTTFYQEEHLYGENTSKQFLYTCPNELKKYPDILPFFNWLMANQKGLKK